MVYEICYISSCFPYVEDAWHWKNISKKIRERWEIWSHCCTVFSSMSLLKRIKGNLITRIRRLWDGFLSIVILFVVFAVILTQWEEYEN